MIETIKKISDILLADKWMAVICICIGVLILQYLLKKIWHFLRRVGNNIAEMPDAPKTPDKIQPLIDSINKGQMPAKGTDWYELTRRFDRGVIERILRGLNSEEAINTVVSMINTTWRRICENGKNGQPQYIENVMRIQADYQGRFEEFMENVKKMSLDELKVYKEAHKDLPKPVGQKKTDETKKSVAVNAKGEAFDLIKLENILQICEGSKNEEMRKGTYYLLSDLYSQTQLPADVSKRIQRLKEPVASQGGTTFNFNDKVGVAAANINELTNK